MTTQIMNIRRWMLAGLALTGAGCSGPVINEDHCWVAHGDQTCMDLFGHGYCSSDHPDCEGDGVPYGCVFEKPNIDECYSPTGNGVSCADPNPAPECSAVADEGGDSGMSSIPHCRDGMLNDGEECDDGDRIDDDECTNACTLPACGDGIKSASNGEVCDGQETPDGTLCTADCQVAGTVIWEFYYNIPGGGEDDVEDPMHEVEVDANGNIDILVEHGGHYRILQFAKTGSLNWDRPDNLEHCKGPTGGLAVGTDGQVIVGCTTDDGGYVCQRNSYGGWAGGLSTGSGVLAVDVATLNGVIAAGNNDANAFLLRYDDGMQKWKRDYIDSQFGPIAIHGEGQIRVWDNSRLRAFSTNATSEWISDLVPIGGDARAMEVDGDNTFVITQDGDARYVLHKFQNSAALFSEVQDTAGVDEGADGLAVLPNGSVIVAGHIMTGGKPHGKLTWFSPDGEEILTDLIEDGATGLTAQLYDVAVSPDGYAVAVGSRKVESESEARLWIRKFAI